MIDFSRNHFQLFGLPERFRFDSEVLDRAYHALQGEVHPDRHAAASATEQRIARGYPSGGLGYGWRRLDDGRRLHRGHAASSTWAAFMCSGR